jgi:homoserine/homoserine lactone efflux protein
MKLFPLYVMMSAVIVASPGPGVVMTLTNALRYGVKNAFPGILGLAAGMVFIAGISSTGLGVLLVTSPVAFTILKYIGAAYLIYLGVRSWIAAPFQFVQVQTHEANFTNRFWESFTLQFTNPKALFFCLGVFPQFFDAEGNFFLQFVILAATYVLLIIAIHLTYASTAARARMWLSSPRSGRILNALTGTMFVLFGVLLAMTKA